MEKSLGILRQRDRHNPRTSVETVMEMLNIVDKVLLMTVNPGNAGLMFLQCVGHKIEKLLALKGELDFEIYWDGVCRMDKIEKYVLKGLKGLCWGRQRCV